MWLLSAMTRALTIFWHRYCRFSRTWRWGLRLFRFHVQREHMAFVFVWLMSLSVMPSRASRVVANGKSSFFFMAASYSGVCMCVYSGVYVTCVYDMSRKLRALSPLHPSTVRRWFPRRGCREWCRGGRGGRVSFPVGIFISLRSTPTRGIAGSSSFNLARKLHVVSHGGCTDLHAASRARGPRPSASSPAPLPCVIDGGHSDRCRGGLAVVPIARLWWVWCGARFLYLMVICTPSLGERPLKSSCHC